MKDYFKANPTDTPQLRAALSDQRHKPQSALSVTLPVLVLSLVLTAGDLFTIKNLFNSIFTDIPAMVWVVSLITAIALDFSMAVAGNVVKQYVEGQRNRQELLFSAFPCAIAFLIAFLLCLFLRMESRDIYLADIGPAQTGLVDLSGSIEAETDDFSGLRFMAAMVLAFLPFVTSMMAFGFSYAASSPAHDMRKLLTRQRGIVQAHMVKLDGEIAQCADLDEEQSFMEQQENQQYEEFLRLLNSQAGVLKQTGRLLLMEKIGTPDAISVLTGQARQAYLETARVDSAIRTPVITEISPGVMRIDPAV